MSRCALTYDLSIIGGGILGVMAAYRAAVAQPQRKIALIERQQFGHGATQYAAALSSTIASTQMIGQLSQESDLFYKHLRKSHPSVPIRSLPILYILNRADISSLKTTGPLRQVEFEDVQEQLPLSQIGTEDVLLQADTSLHIDSLGLVNILVEQLRRLPNVDLFENQAVSQILPSHSTSKYDIVISTKERPLAKAQKVLLTLGPWSKSAPLCNRFLDNSCRIKKVVSMSLEKQPPSQCPVIFFVQDDAFLLPAQDRFVFSIHSDEWDVNPDLLPDISDRDRERGISILKRYAPDILAHYKDGNFFCDCYSRDDHPVVQPHPDLESTVVATGGHGRGVRLAPAIARLALDLLDSPTNQPLTPTTLCY